MAGSRTPCSIPRHPSSVLAIAELKKPDTTKRIPAEDGSRCCDRSYETPGENDN